MAADGQPQLHMAGVTVSVMSDTLWHQAVFGTLWRRAVPPAELTVWVWQGLPVRLQKVMCRGAMHKFSCRRVLSMHARSKSKDVALILTMDWAVQEGHGCCRGSRCCSAA